MRFLAKPTVNLVLSVLGAWCLMKATDMAGPAGTNAMWVGAAICIAAFTRGLVIAEQGNPLGEVFGRAGEVILLMGAGYSNDWVVKVGGVPVGWVAAAAALLTEFVRGMGGAHTGVLPATRRMVLLAVASLACVFEPYFRHDGKIEATMQLTLAVVIAGSAATLWARLAGILQDSSKKSRDGS